MKWLVGVQGRASEVALEWAEGADCSIFCVRIYPSEPSWKASSDHVAVFPRTPKSRKIEKFIMENRLFSLGMAIHRGFRLLTDIKREDRRVSSQDF